MMPSCSGAPKNVGIHTKIESLSLLEQDLWSLKVLPISRGGGKIDQWRFGALWVGFSKRGLHHRIPRPRKPTHRHNSHASIYYSSQDILDIKFLHHDTAVPENESVISREL